jgi:thymidylate synthase
MRRDDPGGPMIRDALVASVNLGTFDRFSAAWLACVRRVMNEGREVNDDGAVLRELLNVSLSASTCAVPDLVAAGADEDRIDLMIRKYESLAILPEYQFSYGKLFREHAGVDQVAWLIRRLRRRPEAKSATIGFHTPGEEALSCISLVDCKLRAGQLHLNAVFRSQNILASQPGNACALRRVQTTVADALGVTPGSMTLHILSAHIYERDWHAAHRVASAGSAGGDISGAGQGGGHDE